MANPLITGLEIDSSGISWSSVRRKKKRLETVDSRRKDVTPAMSPDGVDFAAEETQLALKKALGGLDGLCCYALPASHILLRVAELPSNDEKELQSMVELQVDKFCPFSIDQMQFSFEIMLRREESARVLIAAVKKDAVTVVGAAFRHGGVILHRLDCRAVVWWMGMAEHGHIIAAHGRQTLLLIDQADISMIVLHHGEPVIFRALGLRHQYETQDDYAELLDEMRFTLTTLEAEWGEAEAVCLDIWCEGEIDAPLRAALGEIHPGGLRFHRWDELPPFTELLARRSAEERVVRINLSPSTWLADERYRATLRKLGLLSVLFAGLWLAVMTILLVFLHVRAKGFDALESGHATLQEQAGAARKLRAKVKSLEQYSDRSRSALEVLREVSVKLPPGVDLTQMNYKKGEAASLKGMAGEAEPIHDFIEAMEQSGMFVQVAADNIVSKRDRDKVRTEFSVELKLPGGD